MKSAVRVSRELAIQLATAERVHARAPCQTSLALHVRACRASATRLPSAALTEGRRRRAQDDRNGQKHRHGPRAAAYSDRTAQGPSLARGRLSGRSTLWSQTPGTQAPRQCLDPEWRALNRISFEADQIQNVRNAAAQIEMQASRSWLPVPSPLFFPPAMFRSFYKSFSTVQKRKVLRLAGARHGQRVSARIFGVVEGIRSRRGFLGTCQQF